MRGFCGDILRNSRRSADSQGFESTDGMKNDPVERVAGVQAYVPL